MAQSSRGERVLSARSIKSSDGELEILSPEGSSVYMTEVKDDVSTPSLHGNSIPINTLLGIPRKTQFPVDSDHTHNAPPLEDHQTISKTHHSTSDVDSSNSDNDQGPPHAKGVLVDAGVDIDLDSLTCSDGEGAPLELLSQFMSCLMRDEHEAAKVLCEKILEFEPVNQTALEFMAVINERIKLDEELPSESSSSESEDSSEDEINFVSSGDDSSNEGSSSNEDEEAVVPSPNTQRGCGRHQHTCAS